MEEVSTQGTIVAPDDAPSEVLVPSTSSHDDSQSSGSRASEIAKRFIEAIDPKVHVDTAAPIDSVKGAVSKFGRRLQLQDEIDKVQIEVTRYQKRWQDVEAGNVQTLHMLETTGSVADKLRLSLKKARIEEAQARHEAELAELRLRKLQQRASEGAAAKEDLDVALDRRAAALSDLQSARAEVASLEKELAAAAADADAVVARARKTAAASREAAKAVEDLAAVLIALKRELESSHAAHRQAEEKRMVFEQDKSQWQSELEESDQEAKRLRDELMAACEVEMKAEAASDLLERLKAELRVACTCTAKETETPGEKAMLEKTRKELEDVKESIEKARDEAKCLRDDLEREKAELAALQRKKSLSEASIPALEEELNRVTSELRAAEARAKEVHDRNEMADQVDEARREAEQAKGKVLSAREEADSAREEASVARAAVAAMEARLEAVKREILAANASEEMAMATASALLRESRPSVSHGGVTLTVEDYDELSRRAREMEDDAGKRVTEAVKLIKEAKDAEVRILEKLIRAAKQTEQRRLALQAATEEAEEAEFAKLSAERELRQWRAEQEPQPRAGLAEISVLDYPGADGHGNPHIVSPRGYMPRTDVMVAAGAAAEAEARQRKTFLPRMVMFLARKRAQGWK